MAQVREKFATQVNADILSEVRAIAEQEGRQLQGLVEEALRDLIEKRRHGNSRAHVMAASLPSHDKYKRLYEKLAK
jgi:hypothetical protein